MQKIVIGLSGGMDSATLLGLLLEQGAEVHCCHFQYGSKQNKYEQEAVANILQYYRGKEYPIRIHPINLEKVFCLFSSNLLLSGEEIPEGHYESESMKKTVVPGRNTIFSSIMLGLAESIEADYIGLGVHSGDHHIYPDCRKEYIKSLDTTLYLASDRKVQVITPLIDDDKASILFKGFKLDPPVPYHLTRTCYKDQLLACGKCGSCRERLEAFSKVGIKDPIQYE